MKIKVTMKDPDALGDALKEAVAAEVEALGLPEDERDALIDLRTEKVADIANRWFEYGEYLQVEIDTDAGTCVVLPVRK